MFGKLLHMVCFNLSIFLHVLYTDGRSSRFGPHQVCCYKREQACLMNIHYGVIFVRAMG